MRVGVLKENCLVRIEPVGERGNFRVWFDDYNKKSNVPKEWKETPWGYDGFKVFLPLEVIEEKLSHIFPGVAFSNLKMEVAA